MCNIVDILCGQNTFSRSCFKIHSKIFPTLCICKTYKTTKFCPGQYQNHKKLKIHKKTNRFWHCLVHKINKKINMGFGLFSTFNSQRTRALALFG